MKRSLLACLWILVLWAKGVCAVTDSYERGVLLVCPSSLMEATEEWRTFRESQGWQITTVTPEKSASESLTAVRRAARLASPKMEAILLIGDGEVIGPAAVHVAAEAIGAWGPEQEIATDRPYGDFDGDGVSDAAVGRLPLNNAIALRRYFNRVVRRERRAIDWSDCQIELVAGMGGFSPLIDTTIEQTATLLIGRLTPPSMGLTLHRTGAHPLTTQEAGLNRPSLAWVYLGHGMRNYLPSCDIRRLVYDTRDNRGPDLAVLLACYAGDFTEPSECVAEQLLAAENGPLAVIAATRISMPYGNTVVGARLLAGLGGSASSFGQLLRIATDAAVRPLSKNKREHDLAGALIADLRPIATLLSGEQADLDAECRDHAKMYCLLGDPLLSLHRPEPLRLEVSDRMTAGQTVALKIESEYAGTLRCALARRGESPIVKLGNVQKGQTIVPISLLPSTAPGAYRLTVSLVDTKNERLAAAGATLRIASQRVAEKTPESTQRR